MYGLRYGTLPVVRRVGGLADTVVDADAAPADGAGGPRPTTGFVFDRPTPAALESALVRAVAVFADKPRWQRMMHDAMARDFSWAASAAQYRDLYDGLLGRPPSGLSAASG
jgi:starch synthase